RLRLDLRQARGELVVALREPVQPSLVVGDTLARLIVAEERGVRRRGGERKEECEKKSGESEAHGIQPASPHPSPPPVSGRGRDRVIRPDRGCPRGGSRPTPARSSPARAASLRRSSPS